MTYFEKMTSFKNSSFTANMAYSNRFGEVYEYNERKS